MSLTLRLPPVAAECAPAALSAALDALCGFYGVTDAQADVLAKALPTHPSHFQPRKAGGQFTKRGPHTATPRTATGQFRQRLDASERAAAVADALRHQGDLQKRLGVHFDDWQKTRFDADTWYERSAADIEHWYELLYRSGKQSVGDPAVKLTPQDRAALNRLVGDELTYLQGFRDDLKNGAGTMPYARRLGMYAQAAWEAYWLGWTLGDQRAAREIRWVLGPTEHCTDCLRFEKLGWTAVLQFVREVLSEGYAPKSGKLECHGANCRCRLEERLGGVTQPMLVYP